MKLQLITGRKYRLTRSRRGYSGHHEITVPADTLCVYVEGDGWGFRKFINSSTGRAFEISEVTLKDGDLVEEPQ